MLLVLISGCKGKEEVNPFGLLGASGVSGLAGKYKLSYYEKRNTVPYEITLEIKNEVNSDGHYLVNGRSCINFYYANLEAAASGNQINMLDVAATKIGGEDVKMKFEQDYFERLSKIESYEIKENGQLVFHLPEANKQYLVFVLNSD